MSDVLIKGLELPKACSWFDEEDKHHSCRFCLAYICSITGDCIASSVERRHPSCPLVALPPHGRLIDADMLFQTYDGFSEDYYERLREIRDTIINAPTVVEANNV